MLIMSTKFEKRMGRQMNKKTYLQNGGISASYASPITYFLPRFEMSRSCANPILYGFIFIVILSMFVVQDQAFAQYSDTPTFTQTDSSNSLVIGKGTSSDGSVHVTITSTPIEIHKPLAIQISFTDPNGNAIPDENYGIMAEQQSGNGVLILSNSSAFAPDGTDIQVTSSLSNLSPVNFQIQLQGSGKSDTSPALWTGSVSIVDITIGSQYAQKTAISQVKSSSQVVTIPYGAYDPNFNTAAPQWYLPSDITVNENQTVTWINQDKEAHTVTSGEAAGRNGLVLNGNGKPNGIFDSGVIKSGESWTHKFTQAGTFQYFCKLHPWMEGFVIVKKNEPVPTDAKGNKIVTFPVVRLVPDRTVEADLDWEPHYITTGEKITFVYQFYDNVNFKPMATYYVFTIIQDGKQLYHIDDSTQFGGAYQYFRFNKPGAVIFRFSDIGHTGQSAQYSTMVYPSNSTDPAPSDAPIVEPARNMEIHWYLMPLFFTPAGIATGVVFWVALRRRSQKHIQEESAKKSPI